MYLKEISPIHNQGSVTVLWETYNFFDLQVRLKSALCNLYLNDNKRIVQLRRAIIKMELIIGDYN